MIFFEKMAWYINLYTIRHVYLKWAPMRRIVWWASIWRKIKYIYIYIYEDVHFMGRGFCIKERVAKNWATRTIRSLIGPRPVVFYILRSRLASWIRRQLFLLAPMGKWKNPLGLARCAIKAHLGLSKYGAKPFPFWNSAMLRDAFVFQACPK